MSWKRELSKKHEIAVSREFSVVERLCREGIVDLVIINTHNARKEFDLNIFRRMRESFPSIPVIAAISYRCALGKDEFAKWGTEHTVTKPFLIRILEEKIEEVLCEQVICSKL